METTAEQIGNIDILVRAEALVNMYQVYNKDFLSRIKMIESELPFCIPLINPATGKPSTAVSIIGKADKLILLHGEHWVMDHKCTVKIPDHDLLSFKSQLDFYVMAYRQKGYEVKGVIWDYMARPLQKRKMVPLCDDDGNPIVIDQFGDRVTTKQKTWRKTEDEAQGFKFKSVIPESDDAYYGRVCFDLNERRETAFQKFPVVRGDAEITETHADVWSWHKMLLDSHSRDSWPRSDSSCESNYGRCPFIPLCARDDEFSRGAFQRREERTTMNYPVDGDKRLESYSSICDFRDCPRLYKWKQIERLEPTTTSEAMRFGSIVHEALDVVYNNGDCVEYFARKRKALAGQLAAEDNTSLF
jgi:hypothetical protein